MNCFGKEAEWLWVADFSEMFLGHTGEEECRVWQKGCVFSLTVECSECKAAQGNLMSWDHPKRVMCTHTNRRCVG